MKEALKLALEAVERYQIKRQDFDTFEEAITAIKAALAQPAQDQSACCAECGKKDSDGWALYCVECIDKAKTLGAQPAQEPVAWMTPDGEGFRIRFSPPTNDVPLGWDALYTAPQQRTWVGLTDEERDAITNKVIGFNNCCGWEDDYAKTVEAKLKEKNQ